MKQGTQRLLSLLLAIVLVVSILPPMPVSAAQEADYYGRNILAQMDNADALLFAYDQVVAGIEDSEATIGVYDGINPITVAELLTVMNMLRNDHTGLFWFSGGYSYSYYGDEVISVSPKYTMTGSTLESAKAAFDAVADQVLAGISPSMSEYEKELFIHDALAARVQYVDSDNAHNAYGALVEGQAVCEGYAEALQYLLQQAGIQSVIITGASENPSTGTLEGHAWNVVRIDGKYYHVDLTWDDQKDLYHAYFNLTDARIQEDHVIYSTDMPVCNSEDAFYFHNKPTYLETYSVASVGKLLKDNGNRVHVYVPGDVDAFREWYFANAAAIGKAAGIYGGFSYGYSILGRELILRLTVSGCSHSNLTKIAGFDPTCTENGQTTYYTCTCGKWFEDAAAQTEIANSQSVVINRLGHDWDEGTVTKEPTEDATGVRTYTCTRCGDTKTAEIPKLEHVHHYIPYVTAPNCTDQGYTTHLCDCGDKYVNSYTDPLGHDWDDGVVTQQPTEDAAGVRTYTCKRCEGTKTTEIPKLDHVHKYTDKITLPLCTVEGYTTHTCKCGHSYVDSYTDPLGHDWDEGTVTKQPTEDATGIRTHTCNRCGMTREDEIPKLAHVHKYKDVVTKPTCFQQGFTTHICKCGDQYTDSYTGPLEHDWDDGVVTQQPTETEEGTLKRTCSLCDLTSLEPIPRLEHTHKYTIDTFEPTCTEQGYTLYSCTCGDYYKGIYTDPLEHSWGEDLVTKAPTETETGILTNVCTRCHKTKETEIPKLGHTHNYIPLVTQPTCTGKGYTTHTCACGDEFVDSYTDPLGHDLNGGIDFSFERDYYTTTCFRCGELTLPAVYGYPEDDIPLTDYEWGVLAITNTMRYYAGLAPFTAYGSIQKACDTRALEVVQYFSHTRPNGTSCFTALNEQNITYWSAGENIARGHHNPKHVTSDWMNSEGHRGNILDPDFSHMGVGYYEKGWVQLFTDGSGHTSFQLKSPDDLHVEPGTALSTLGIYAVLTSSRYGQCYLPILDEYCTGYDAATPGTQTVTVQVLGFTGTFTITVGEPQQDPCANGHTPEIRGAVKATCQATGYTGDTYCTVCETLIQKGTVIPKADHNYTASVTKPTCTEKGYTTHTCACGHSFVDSYAEPIGHDMGNWTVVTAATCTAKGSERRDCNRCDHYETQDTDMIPHSHTSVVTDPTCTEKGFTTHTCPCGDEYVDSYTDPLEHDWDDGVVTKQPTEEETGVRTHTCDRCGNTKTAEIPRLDHVHKHSSVVTDPTCTEKGFTTHTCPCGDKYVDSYTDPLDHDWNDGVVTKQPTEEETGVRTYTCDRCGDTKTAEIPRLDHVHKHSSVVTDPTCTEKGYTTHTCPCGDKYVDSDVDALGHDWDNPTASFMTCQRCGATEGTPPIGSGYRIALNVADVGETKAVWIDGVEYPVITDGDQYLIDLGTTDATNLVVYTFNDPNAEDVHTQYPIGMKVWILKFDGTAYTATYVPEFDNLLQYSGSSIRIVGVKGIRMITSIDRNTKNALTGKGLAGYTLVEYGTALAWASEIENGLVLGQEYTKSNYAYKKDVADPIFATTKTHIQYTNVLVGFNDDQCIPDIAMRPYIILADADGNQVTVYGGIVYRNIGYIAYQNRSAFKPGSSSYNYVWGIIHHVYGDQFDSEFKG